MQTRLACCLLLLTTLFSISAAANAFAQEPFSLAVMKAEEPLTATPSQSVPVAKPEPVIVPLGTRLPLLLRNGINTHTAKPGDSVYFVTAYPIAVNNRIVIPMGSFMRGQILDARRPGFIRGRGEFRIALEQMTFSNGYTIELRATPSSVDRDGREGVDSEGKVIGPSSAGRDTATVLLATAGGAYIGTLAGGVINDAPGKGALIGGGVGGLAGLIAVLATRGPEARLPRGTTMDVVFDRPLILDASYLPTNVGAGNDPLQRRALQSESAAEKLREQQKKQIEQSLLPLLLQRFL